MAHKSDKKPAKARYISEDHLLKNKISKLKRYVREHPTDKQTESRLVELVSKLKPQKIALTT